MADQASGQISMKIQENISLAQYTTFKIGGPARFFCSVTSKEEVRQAVSFAKKRGLPFFVLGGGSNILVSDNGFPGLVIKVEIMGIREEGIENKGERKEDVDEHVLISVGAGEMWDSFVEYTVSRGLSGLENLSAIPGSVGAAPIQNIGAYGAEARQFISSVRAFDARRMAFVELSNKECEFAYRDSMFKRKKGRYIVTRVDFRLKKGGPVNIVYNDLRDHFASRGIAVPTPDEVRRAVIDIRWSKLPDWKLWGTAGSFFKNPVVSARKYASLKKRYPGLPGFPEPRGKVKIPLGWILDNVCHARGMRKGGVGTYEKQALVFVARPGAASAEVVELAQELMKKVKDATGITIEGEVEWVN